ncbi:MAG TPA: hypothetical protein VM425_08880 [Myxococcota bacterium]|nr:hypothetical protein [Myxococcota bacterium]
MNPGPPPPLEFVASLAEEINQAIDWLQDPPENLTNQELRLRIQTLREAARVTGMNAVESVLDGAERELSPDDPVKEPALFDSLIERLCGLANSLAETLQESERNWFERIRTTGEDLGKIARGIQASTERLNASACLVEKLALEPRPTQRTRLAGVLGREIAELTAEQRSSLKGLQQTLPELQDIMHDLSREISFMHNASITPVLARLRQRVRAYSRQHGKPVSFVAHCTGVRVAAFQIKPLEKVLEQLVDDILSAGFESTGERRQTGKATVGSLNISGNQEKALTSVLIKDDGNSQRPPAVISTEIREQLGSLRARLLMIPSSVEGRQLLLQLPSWHEILDVLPVRTTVGEVLVPLDVIAEVFSAAAKPAEDLPVVSLARRSNDEEENQAGLIFDIDGWRAVMYADVLGAHFSALQSPPQAGDPAWTTGRICEEGRSLPILHPLSFMDVEEGVLCLYPVASS